MAIRNMDKITFDGDQIKFPASAILQEDLEGEISELKSGISDLKEDLTTDGAIRKFLYLNDHYINTSGTEVELNGYNLYRIPVETGDLITISASEAYWGTLSAGTVHIIQVGTVYYSIPAAVGSVYGMFANSANKVIAIAPVGATYFYVNALAAKESAITIRVNNNGAFATKRTAIKWSNTKANASILTGFYSEYYPRADKTFRRLAGYSVYPVAVSMGDVIYCENLPSGLTFFGTFQSKTDLTTVSITNVFEAPSDGVAYLFSDYAISPNNSITTEQLQFRGVNGVAFGTSLTYRALTTYGYLQYLPQLSGITFDNQGVGGSGIMTGTLTAIQNYADYSSKRIAIIEGFVNDWYNSEPLGEYTDTGTETACGCLRSAINYIMAQNPNIQVFVVLDHYGKSATGGTCASTAVNSNNLTQYQYYEEMAKVCESLGIPAIKLYSTSGISENTPQYLVDNIHPTKIGARQTAYCIWYAMRKYPISQTE